jgi:transcriptional regulator with XRE-family HTH domain
MMNGQLALCELWSLGLPAYPPHSRLYALEPLGVGTPYAESLTSYVSRLAEAHSVSLRTLVIQELLPLLKQDYLFNSLGNSLAAFWIEAARALNGTGALAQGWAQALQHLTLRTDLRSLTFLPWTAVLTQQRLLRITRAWCPDCLVEWQTAGHPIYEPLLWKVMAVSICLRHRRALMEVCPHPNCGATLPVLASRFHPGYCSKCSGWLGFTAEQSNPAWTAQQWQWHFWVAEAIGELIAHQVDPKISPHLSNIPSLIAASRDQAGNGSTQNLAERLQLSRRTVNAWHSGKQIPQLESLLRLCYCGGVSLYDLFTAPSGALDLSKIRIGSLPDLPNPTGQRRRRTHFDTPRIQQDLENTLVQKETPPPSLRTVAKHLNYSPRELREHFPGLCRAISNRRKNYFKSRREQRLHQREKEVQQAILAIHAQGSYPSSHRVGALLSDPAALRDPIIYKFWRTSIQKLNQAG